MRYFGVLAAWTATLLVAFPASAWNFAGHRIVAAIAYQNLTPQARARVDDLIRRHPDYTTILTKDAPTDPAARARAAFLTASTWPDIIRGDPRLYDDTQNDAVPTPLLPGFPDMKKHTNWHYIDLPYSVDGTPGEKPKAPNALTELQRLLRTSPMTPYNLIWIEHLTGDLHQPLHCTSEFMRSLPKGDAGGNFIFVQPGPGQPGVTLHLYWDALAGTDESDSYVTAYAASVTAEHPAPKRFSKNVDVWVHEGYELAKSHVYKFGPETGSREHPLMLPSGYEEKAKIVARQQIATAGYRLAAVLNEALTRP